MGLRPCAGTSVDPGGPRWVFVDFCGHVEKSEDISLKAEDMEQLREAVAAHPELFSVEDDIASWPRMPNRNERE